MLRVSHFFVVCKMNSLLRKMYIYSSLTLAMYHFIKGVWICVGWIINRPINFVWCSLLPDFLIRLSL